MGVKSNFQRVDVTLNGRQNYYYPRISHRTSGNPTKFYFLPDRLSLDPVCCCSAVFNRHQWNFQILHPGPRPSPVWLSIHPGYDDQNAAPFLTFCRLFGDCLSDSLDCWYLPTPVILNIYTHYCVWPQSSARPICCSKGRINPDSELASSAAMSGYWHRHGLRVTMLLPLLLLLTGALHHPCVLGQEQK